LKTCYIKLFSKIAIFCLGIIAYSNTFHSPFHFDDKPYIINNFSIRNLQDLSNIWAFCPCRFITFLTLALNYHFSQLDVFGYHLFNLAVHLASACFVWWLTLLTLSTPAMKENKISRHADIIALFAGLIFVSHPVQIEAVTYIWQRAASLSAFFYLASLCFYVRSRLTEKSVSFYYICSLIIAVAAMFTKENAITLPLMIVLYEFGFFKSKRSLNWKYLFPFLLTLFIIPVTMLLTNSERFQEIQGVVQGPRGISPTHYLLTQFRVMITYIRLAFIPIDQNLDYDYPVFKNILELPVLISFLSLIIIFYFAGRLFSKYRLISFSIFWFFLTLLPESSFLPLKDVIFEHRLYLPMAGYSMFVVGSIYYVLGKNDLKTMVKTLIVILACYSILTYQRNKIWSDDLVLWNDVVHKSPHKARPYNNRGNIYTRQGELPQALSDYNKAIELDPDYADAYNDRGSVYGKQGDLTQALSDFNKAIELDPNYADAYNNRGDVFGKQGDFAAALPDFNKVIELNPDDAEAHYNRGVIFDGQGDFIQAMSDYNKAIEINPDIAEAYIYRGAIYAKEGNTTQAMSDFTKAININPNYGYAFNNRAVLYYQLQQYDNAWKDVHQSEALGFSVNPKFINDLQKASGRDN
jgi:protein O-mannosyl-transferase